MQEIAFSRKYFVLEAVGLHILIRFANIPCADISNGVKLRQGYITFKDIRKRMVGALPIGMQDFKKIRNNNRHYVDKTDIIPQIISSPAEVFLFTRPRRFGKSLNLSTTDAFFNLKYKGNTWFDGLKVSGHKECEPFKNRYPVIYLDFKNTYGEDMEYIRVHFNVTFSNLCLDHLYLAESEKLDGTQKDIFAKGKARKLSLDEIPSFMSDFCRMLYMHHGTKPIVLIDEYDNPVHHAFGKSNERKTVELIGDILSPY